MATVTGMTADRMKQIEAQSVIDGDVVGDNLILTQHDGTQINAGSVRGPKGDPGPVGQDLSVLKAVPILDVGQVNQIRAGRQLTVADFTNMGLSAPIGLWNLSDLTDASGNGHPLLNKGAVPVTTGINGVANTAARFTGDQNQALYIPDAGASDPFRIRTGSLGCWFRANARNGYQMLIAKWDDTGGVGAYKRCYRLYIDQSNVLILDVSATGSDAVNVVGKTDVADNKWHFAVGCNDGGKISLYLDGKLQSETKSKGPCCTTVTVPFNLGNSGADSSLVGAYSAYSLIDETFVTADVLSLEQIRQSIFGQDSAYVNYTSYSCFFGCSPTN